jgi:superfamily II DNA or RNA helicase
MHTYTQGMRIALRGEDFLIRKVEPNGQDQYILQVEGISELVKGQHFIFDTELEDDISTLSPEHTRLVADHSRGYQATKLYIETEMRAASLFSDKIEVGHKAAINPAAYQYTPTLQALKLARPRILIADAVGLGKTIEVGIFLSEMIKRGRGQRILVLALKSILGQFQQEIWARFAIPLVRLDSVGIAQVRAKLPLNKNPFDYYDKTIISIDTLKNNAKFRHYIEKTRWDIIVIDECHTVSNVSSQRGNLAQFLATKCESLVLTSATPHNGKKEQFANLIRMLEPTAIPQKGDFNKDDIKDYYVRRFKKDISAEVQKQFKDRKIEKRTAKLSAEEIAFLEFKKENSAALNASNKNRRQNDLLFSTILFKGFMSSPEACLATVKRRKEKLAESKATEENKTAGIEVLAEAERLLEDIIEKKTDSKYNALKAELKALDWKGTKNDNRIIIFSERRETLQKLEKQLKADFKLKDKAVVLFDGSLADTQQQELVEDFGKGDSEIRLFLTSDAGAQGVNLHYHCHIMFNYDVPWSLITLEQRNGRIDRYGQKETPYIYYLLLESEDENIKTDFHIIDKLVQKEEEVHNTLGDAQKVLKLYDSEEEEKALGQAIETQQIDFWEAIALEQDPETDSEETDLWFDLDESTEVVIEEEPVSKALSFYRDDFNFYEQLCNYITVKDPSLQNLITVTTSSKFIELFPNDEVKRVLYDLPKEAKPDKTGSYKLSARVKDVQKAIEDARKTQKAWPNIQTLYDLHPIVQWWMSKLQAHIDKDVALVVKTENIPTGERWFCFHCVVSNNLGQAIISDFIAVRDNSFEHLDLREFVDRYNLDETLSAQAISDEEILFLQKRIKSASNSAHHIYMGDKKDEVEDQMKATLANYKEQLKDWLNTSKNQLQLDFDLDDIDTIQLQGRQKQKEAIKIKTILSETSQFYENMASLEGEPFLKLLAVFFNPA